MSEAMPGRGMTPEELRLQEERDIHKGEMLKRGASYSSVDNKEGHQLVAAQHHINAAKNEMYHELGDRSMSEEQRYESNIHQKELKHWFKFDSMEEVDRFIEDDAWYEGRWIDSSEVNIAGPTTESSARSYADMLSGFAITGAALKKKDWSFWKKASFRYTKNPMNLSPEEKEPMDSFPFASWEDAGRFLKDDLLYASKISEDDRHIIIGPLSDTHKDEWIEKGYSVDTGKRIKDMYQHNLTAWSKVIFHKNKESKS